MMTQDTFPVHRQEDHHAEGRRGGYVESLFAAARLGAIAVPLNWRLTAAELAFQVGDGEPRLLLADPALRPLVDALRGEPEMRTLDRVVAFEGDGGLEEAQAREKWEGRSGSLHQNGHGRFGLKADEDLDDCRGRERPDGWVSFDINARSGDRLSLATTLICTNDGFLGLDAATLPDKGRAVYVLDGYDSGTEDNTEQSVDRVNPVVVSAPRRCPAIRMATRTPR